MKYIDRITKNEIVQKSLRFSVIEGIFSGAMTGFVQEYLTPFLLLLGGRESHVGILNALPNLAASLIQIKSADIVVRLRSRKKLITFFVFLQAITLIPMAFTAFLGHVHPFVFIALVVLFASCAALSNPAWGSLMSDLVPGNKRGDFFGWRGQIIGFITVGASLFAGFILYFMKKINVYYGFVILFACASVFRMTSWSFLMKMHEPHLDHKREHHFTLRMFLKRLGHSNFAKFVLFVALLNFSVNLASPFFAVLLIKDLSFNYALYIIIMSAASISIYLNLNRWGKHADKVGNLKVIKLTAPLIGGIPLLWIISRHPLFLITSQIFSGFVWAGFNLCTTNFIYDAVTPEKRTRCISYFNLFNSLALCCGALCGGFLVNRLPSIAGFRILTLFLISSIIRLMIGFSLPRRLKEVRSVEHVRNYQLFFSMIGVRPLLGIERKTLRY